MISSRPLVVVTRRLPDPWLAELRARCDVRIGPRDPVSAQDAAPEVPGFAPELLEHLPRARAVLSLLTEPIGAAVLDRASNLKVVSNMAVGVDNIDVETCTRRRVPVGHTPGVLTEATADLTLSLMLAASRRLLEAANDARAGRWTTWSPTGWLGRHLGGSTLGIVGLGKIGRAVARRAQAFGMKILFTRRTEPPSLDQIPGARRVELPELLAASDVVSLHVPLTPQTRGLIEARALGRMKPTALLINTARGPIVDTDALVEAVDAGVIAGAALDVTDPEPLPAEHRLYTLANVLVAPHIGSATWGTRAAMAELAVANVLAALDGRPLPHCVNPEVDPGRG